ncbi:hypothetical protein XELAEV_18022605mg [Xenopus laevis]|nr:hypothetical protein XELAEV_18022605mg [Xenopus laevis]
MAYANKSPNEYNLNNAISQSFSGTFLQSGNIEDFYSSTSNSLLPKLYSQYTGFITDGNCFLLGSPRIRQLRRAFESANGQSQYNKEETGNYKAGWVPLGKNDTPDCEWKYYTEKELVGYPIWGQLGWYSGGGFVVELGKNISYASSTLTWLQTNQWLDTYTKAVFVEFNVYNANVQLFCLVTFLMETSAIG